MDKQIVNRAHRKITKAGTLHWILVATQIASALTWNSALYANPTDGNVVAGAAAISQSGHVLKVDQTSDRAIINWGGFSIGAGETVKFNQPGANSAILNRVIGGDPSAIMGSMQANGQVFLINPNGIVFGAGARVDVGSIVASTLNISDSQFMAGGGAYDFKGDSKAGVYNYGEIRALQGDIYLIGATVSNAGLLQANGTVGLAAGQDVRLVDSANPHLVVRATSQSIGGTGITNSGTIDALQAELVANGGNVYALAINNTGTIRATGSKTVGGRVYLLADGSDISTSGDIIAKQGTDGGYVEINTGGKDGTLASINGNIDVSGVDKGGTVFIRTANLNLVGSNINTSGAIPGMLAIVFGEDSILYEGPTPGDEVVSDPGSATTTTGTMTNPPGQYSDRTNLAGQVDIRRPGFNNDMVVLVSSTSDSVQSGTGTTIVPTGGGTLENVTLEARDLGYNPGNAYANATIYNAFSNIQFTVNGTNGQPVTVTVEGYKNNGAPYSFSITDNLGNGNNTFHFQDDGAGYVITKVSISGAAASMTQISQIRIAGETLIPLPGTIVVQKFTTGGDGTFNFTSTGGSNLPADFSIVTSGGSGSNTYEDIAAGAYSITEIVPAGWKLVRSSSTSGTPGSFEVANGQTVTVMFFNEKLGQIIVQKSIVTGSLNNPGFDFNLSGKDATDVDFSLAGAGTIQSGPGANDLPYLDPGQTYTLAELLGLNGQPLSGGNELPNWDFTNVVVTKNGVGLDLSTNASQHFTVAAGDVFRFNFTNTERGQIFVNKNVAGGSDTSASFSFTATGGPSKVTPFSLSQDDGTYTVRDVSGATTVDYLKPGTYTITELAKAGWFFDGIDPANGTAILDNQASVTLAPGGSVTLVFGNSEGGKITVNKSLGTTSQNNPNFDFNLNSPEIADVNFSLAGNGSIQSGSGVNDLPYLRPGETYTVAELLGLNGQPLSGGNELPNWDFTNVVVIKNGVVMEPSTNASQQFTVGAGDVFNFTFTNTERGQILVNKSVAAGSDTSATFGFTASGGPSTVGAIPALSDDDPAYALQDTSGVTPVSYLKPGVYTIAELAKAGWFFDGIDPVDGAVINGNEAEVTLAAGGSVTLNFRNSQGGQIMITKKVSDGSSTSNKFTFTATGSPSTIGTIPELSQDDGTYTLQDINGNGITGDAVDYLRPGFYTITELAEAGWFFDGIDPVEGATITKNQAVVEVVPGGEVNLVYNNTQGGQIAVNKYVYGDQDTEFDFTASGGPSNIAGTFTLSNSDGTLLLQDLNGNGITNAPVDYLMPGTYTVKELAELGWFFDFVVGAQEFDNPEATVAVSPGQTAFLSFYNTQGAQVMVTKVANGPAGPTTDFDFHAVKEFEGEGEGESVIAMLTPGVDSFGPGENEYYFMLRGGQSTQLSEDPQTGYVRPGYYTVTELAEMGWFFDGVTGGDTTSGQSASVYVGPGDIANLTFYNTQGAQIIVNKEANGPNGSSTPFNFFAVPGPQAGGGGTVDTQFILQGGESKTLSSNEMMFYLRPGTYTVAEGSPVPPWFFSGITGADWVLGRTGTVTLDAGEVANLTFTNVYRLPILTFFWEPIYPEGFGGAGFPSYGAPEERPDDELTGNSSAGVYQP